MSTPIKIISSRNNIFVAIIFVIILPISFIVISYLFRDEVTIDKPKLLEELAKSIVALFLSLIGIFVSNALGQKELSRKSKALRYQVCIEVGLLNKLTDELISEEELLDKTKLSQSSADVIRKNYNNEKEFRILVENLKEKLESIYHMVMAEPPDVRMICLDYSTLLSECISASEDYLDRPSSLVTTRIRLYLRNLQRLHDKED